MLISLYFYILSKHWKKLFFYLSKDYKFYGPVINTSNSGWLKRIVFASWIDFYNFTFLVNELQLDKSTKINLIKKINRKKKLLKVISSLNQEEQKVLPKKYGTRYKKNTKLKKKTPKLFKFNVMQNKKKIKFNRLYIKLEKNLMSYKFFEANFFSPANYKIGIQVYYLFCFSRMALLKILLFVHNLPFYAWNTKR